MKTKHSFKHLALSATIALCFSSHLHAQEEEGSPIPLDMKVEREELIKDLSFKQLERLAFPVNEEQVRGYKLQAEEMLRLANEDLRNLEVQTRSLKITPSVSQTEQSVLSSANFTTNLIFVDSMGKPWPITKWIIGANNFFTVDQYMPHALMISPLIKYKKTNLTVVLKGIETVPVVLTLREDPKKVDYIVETKVNGFVKDDGSNTEYSHTIVQKKLGSNIDGVTDAERDMSDGITPKGAKNITVLVNEVESFSIKAWRYKKHYYVKTKGELIIPNGKLITTSVDESKLYQIPPISGLMIQRDGVMMTNIKLIPEETGTYEVK